MFNFLRICCESAHNDNNTEKQLDFGKETQYTYTEGKLQLVDYIENLVNNKLGLIILYSSQSSLFPFNNIKKDQTVSKVLTEYYHQLYRDIKDQFSRDLLTQLQWPTKDLTTVTFIITIENKELKVVDKLENNQVNSPSLKRFLIENRYKGIKLGKEPNQNLNNVVEINFKSFSGNSISRLFMDTDKIEQIYQFVRLNFEEFFKKKDYFEEFEVFQIHPLKVYKEFNKTLKEEGLGKNAVLQIRLLEKENQEAE